MWITCCHQWSTVLVYGSFRTQSKTKETNLEWKKKLQLKVQANFWWKLKLRVKKYVIYWQILLNTDRICFNQTDHCKSLMTLGHCNAILLNYIIQWQTWCLFYKQYNHQYKQSVYFLTVYCLLITSHFRVKWYNHYWIDWIKCIIFN